MITPTFGKVLLDFSLKEETMYHFKLLNMSSPGKVSTTNELLLPAAAAFPGHLSVNRSSFNSWNNRTYIGEVLGRELRLE